MLLHITKETTLESALATLPRMPDSRLECKMLPFVLVHAFCVSTLQIVVSNIPAQREWIKFAASDACFIGQCKTGLATHAGAADWTCPNAALMLVKVRLTCT